MSNPENIVVSLDMARALKKAGRNKETVFRWVTLYTGNIGRHELTSLSPVEYSINDKSGFDLSFTAAPTFQEIWEELPSSYGPRSLWSFVLSREDQDIYQSNFGNSDMELWQDFDIDLNTLPNKAATVWLWCKENGYLDTKE